MSEISHFSHLCNIFCSCRFDVGPILHQKTESVPNNCTSESLCAMLANTGADMVRSRFSLNQGSEKRELGLFFDNSVSAIVTAAILSVMCGG